MRVLVTGAGGFLGRHLVAGLAERGWQVLAGVQRAEEAAGLPATPVAADITDRNALAATVREGRPDRIVHLAGLSHVGASWQDLAAYHRVNVEGTAHVVQAAAGRPVLFASSAEVYGEVPEPAQPIADDRPPAPRSPYAMTKAAAELIVEQGGGRSLRLFNLIGTGQAPKFALASFARQLAAIARGEAEPLLRVGNLQARRDFLHVGDAVAAFALLLEGDPAGPPCNVGSGTAISIDEALDRLIDLSGLRVERELDPARLRPVDIPLLCARTDRLRSRGWRPDGGLDRGLAELWESVNR